jgi:hypothetical protein
MTLRTSALFSDPGRADVSGHFGTSVLPPLKPQRRPRQFKPFEAQSHGFCARLLRFVQGSPQCYARMAPGCRPALPGGLGFPLGHDRRFRSAIASHLPSPGFSWRQVFRYSATRMNSTGHNSSWAKLLCIALLPIYVMLIAMVQGRVTCLVD